MSPITGKSLISRSPSVLTRASAALNDDFVRRAHDDFFSWTADFESQRKVESLRCVDFDAIEFDGLESLRRLSCVSSGIDRVEAKTAAAVGDSITRHAGCQICDLDGGVGNAGAIRIFDSAGDKALARLR